MHAHRFVLVLTVLVANLACRAGGEPAFVQLTEARRLVAEMRINFTKGSDASDRAVLADTDEASIKFAHEADAATEAVQAAMPGLAQCLNGLGHADDVALLTRFQERFARYRTLDREVLTLAVENTNLKAQRLLFGPVGEAANEFCNVLRTLPVPAQASSACRFADTVARAQLAVREIQVLEAPHIAAAQEREMDRLEQEMASRRSAAREALAAIERDSRPTARPRLDAAKAALDSFTEQSRKLIELSRRNTNVRSLELAMRQKPALTSACDESLAALQDALASQGFSGTR